MTIRIVSAVKAGCNQDLFSAVGAVDNQGCFKLSEQLIIRIFFQLSEQLRGEVHRLKSQIKQHIG